MVEREVQPEILDGLSPDDPEAIRSRRDLALINALMGNHRWLHQAVSWALGETERPVWELGAGDGVFLEQLDDHGVTATGVDLLPKPDGIGPGIGWRQGDVFEALADGIEGIVVANLFLHHFERERLAELGALLGSCEVLCISEPWRSHLARLEGLLLFPWVNRVTRHDMMASIRAGFRRGELPGMMGLGEDWHIREESTLLGAYRLLAWKKA